MRETSQVSSTGSTGFPSPQDQPPQAQILEIQPLACTQEATEVSPLFHCLSHPHPLCLSSFLLPLKGWFLYFIQAFFFSSCSLQDQTLLPATPGSLSM